VSSQSASISLSNSYEVELKGALTVNNSSHRSKTRLDSCIIATSVSNQMPTTNHELGYSQTKPNREYLQLYCQFLTSIRDSQLIRAPRPIAMSANGLSVSQERRFGSNHLVFLKARPRHAMGRWEARILGYTRYDTLDWQSSTGRR